MGWAGIGDWDGWCSWLEIGIGDWDGCSWLGWGGLGGVAMDIVDTVHPPAEMIALCIWDTVLTHGMML